MSHLDFEQTVAHLHGLLGCHVSVAFRNHEVPNREGFAGFQGPLGHAKKPELAELQAAGGHDRADAFYVGDDPRNHSWFTIDERTFKSAELAIGKNDVVNEQLTVDVEGLHVVIAAHRT
jgi:hypothetical protein